MKAHEKHRLDSRFSTIGRDRISILNSAHLYLSSTSNTRRPCRFLNQSLVAMMIPLFTIVLALVPAQARRAQESNYSQPAYFKFYQDNLGAEYLKRCFKRQVPPNDGDSCRRNAKACLSGQQTCPKETPGGDIQSSSR